MSTPNQQKSREAEVVREALEWFSRPLANKYDAGKARPALAAFASLEEQYEGVVQERDKALDYLKREGKVADALNRELRELKEQLEAAVNRSVLAQEDIGRLRAALGAYRSALRSGEPESDRMRDMGNAAIDASYPASRPENA